jgi:phosphogluconate dehydratase
MGYVTKTLLDEGLLHEDVNTIMGHGLTLYTKEPKLANGEIKYEEGPNASLNNSIIRAATNPFQSTGGLKVLKGNIGISVIKTSAVDPIHYFVEADAIVFDDQDDLITAFQAGELEKDFIAVIPFQGPKHKGMPELHKLTPSLTILQKRGFKVALITDGRMSGASGKVPAAIHVSPEASIGGVIGKIKTGDRITIDAKNGIFNCLEKGIESRPNRTVTYHDMSHGRQLFKNLRGLISGSEEGAGIL